MVWISFVNLTQELRDENIGLYAIFKKRASLNVLGSRYRPIGHHMMDRLLDFVLTIVARVIMKRRETHTAMRGFHSPVIRCNAVRVVEIKAVRNSKKSEAS